MWFPLPSSPPALTPTAERGKFAQEARCAVSVAG